MSPDHDLASSPRSLLERETLIAKVAQVKRYDLVECAGYYGGHELDASDDGEWVRFDDVLAALGGLPPGAPAAGSTADLRAVLERAHALTGGVCADWREAPRRNPAFDPRRCLRCAHIEAEHVLRQIVTIECDDELPIGADVEPAETTMNPDQRGGISLGCELRAIAGELRDNCRYKHSVARHMLTKWANRLELLAGPEEGNSAALASQAGAQAADGKEQEL